MSPVDINPEEPQQHSDHFEDDVISSPGRFSYSRKRAIILIVALLIAVSALSATVAVTADRAINGNDTPDMVNAAFELGVSEEEPKDDAEENGADRNLSPVNADHGEERDLAPYCPVSIVAVGYGPSTSSAARQCGLALGRGGCTRTWCDIFVYTPVYQKSRRRWYIRCDCN